MWEEILKSYLDKTEMWKRSAFTALNVIILVD